MPRKSKKTVNTSQELTQEAQSAQSAPEVPKDLQDQLSAIRAIAQSYNLLQKGYFPHGFAPAIEQSLQFLQALHVNALNQAKAHPAANMVSELVAVAQGESNGQAK